MTSGFLKLEISTPKSSQSRSASQIRN